MTLYTLYLIVLRLIHIGAGIYWVGAALVQALFLERAARAAEPESGRFMHALNARFQFPASIGISSFLTVGAGVLLYWHASGGLSSAWILSGVGLGYTVGALAALVSLALGLAVFMPAGKQLETLGAAVGPGGPSPAQAAEIGRLNARMSAAGRWDVVVLVIAVVGMAGARYMLF